MTTLHLVLPDGVDDPARPSGGNVYDRRVAEGLAALGWQVVEHAVPGPWPWPDPAATGRLAETLAAVPAGGLALVDGLVASASPEVIVPAARRLALGVLVHLPLGVETAYARAGERAVLLAARTVVATSSWTRDWLTHHYGLGQVHAAPPGVDPAPVAAGSATGSALLAVGRACSAKGYDVLAAALRSLDDLAWSCTWAGPVDPSIHATTIDLAGPLSRAALAERYRAADLVVLPSRGETYGMVLTEALARGVPVLASDVGGVREAVGRTPDGRLPGMLVPPGEPAPLAGALRRWLTDPDLRATLRAAAVDRRATLAGWDGTAARVADALPAPAGARR
jgi:glycosyltransferase involved in cell wall biosynthesis